MFIVFHHSIFHFIYLLSHYTFSFLVSVSCSWLTSFYFFMICPTVRSFKLTSSKVRLKLPLDGCKNCFTEVESNPCWQKIYCSSELQAPFFTSDKLFRLYSLKYISRNFVWYSRKFDISLAFFTWKTMQKGCTILPTFLLIFISLAWHVSIFLMHLPLQLITITPFTHA